MADVMTFEEKRGPIRGRKLAWVGDGNNMATSLIHAAVQFGFRLDLACPAELQPSPKVLQWAGAGRGGHLDQRHAAALGIADAVDLGQLLAGAGQEGDQLGDIHRGTTTEYMDFDDDGLVRRSEAYYGAA